MDVRRVAYLAATACLVLALAGCAFSFFGYERRAEWRDGEERACLINRDVRATAWIVADRKIDGKGPCGIYRPLSVTALDDGTVGIGPQATLNCPMTASVEHWLDEAVQPAAVAWLGAPIVEIKQISSYACRPKNNEAGESLSEHAFGNALDVAGFRLQDGRTILVKRDWNGDPNAQGFLREIFAAACERFKTVLGPGVKYHGDHIHIDLAHHNSVGTSRYCRPVPVVSPPRRAPIRGRFVNAGLLDWNRTGSIGPTSEPGDLLATPPPDVIANELSDPFGVYDGNPDDETLPAPVN